MFLYLTSTWFISRRAVFLSPCFPSLPSTALSCRGRAGESRGVLASRNALELLAFLE